MSLSIKYIVKLIIGKKNIIQIKNNAHKKIWNYVGDNNGNIEDPDIFIDEKKAGATVGTAFQTQNISGESDFFIAKFDPEERNQV